MGPVPFLALIAGQDFAFLHLSDTHVDPRAPGAAAPASVRGEETFEWIARCVAQFDSADIPRPELALITGDMTEFGAPGDTWRDVERLFGRLPVPWYPVLGNHVPPREWSVRSRGRPSC